MFLQICLFALAFMPAQVMAQRCDVDGEAIFKLNEAEIGAFAIWDGVHGDENHEEGYAGGVLLDHGHVVVAGTRGSLGKPYPELILAEVDRRGRVVWETKRNVKGLDQVLGSVAYGKDVLVRALVSDGRERTALWVGVFSKKGALRAEKIFRHGGGSVVHGDIIPAQKGRGLVMVLSTKDKRSEAPRYSEFYRLNSKLQVISKRAYNPGPDNGVYSITPIQNGEYLVSGYINNARGRKNGWLLKVDHAGGIVWQQQYPRGIGAEFVKAAEMPDGSYVVLGAALPAEEDALKAGWAVHIDPTNAEIKWQRYFRDDADLSGKDILVSKDGLISLMLEAKPVKGFAREEGEKAKDFVRLVTLNPRGVIFDSMAYFQGEVADAHDMLLGPSRERIMVGTTQIAYQKDEGDVIDDDKALEKPMDKAMDKGAPIVKRSDEGWIVAAPAMQSYEDPCKPKKPRVLNSL